ncbi:MAG: hypothetical protein IJK40_09740, partial [Clostridia bacterium]|nr:hypothetical protein [Clostridia bacterium]
PNHENGLVFKKPNGGILHVYIRNNQLAQKTVAGSWDANYGGNARPMVFSFYRMGFAFNPGFDYAKRLTPDAPAGLKAEITGPDSVRLSWNAVEGADRYIIYEGTGVPIGETEQTSITVRLTEDGKKSVFYVGAQREVDGYTLDSTFSAPAEVSVPSDNPSFLPGDVNNDGAVGADDARLALRRSVDLETYAEGSRVFLACDANHDGSVGADDARLILRASVDLETLA